VKRTEKGRIIEQLISDFSEDWWCAGWLENIEHTVWMLGNGHGELERQKEEAKRIVDLGKEWDVWVRWNDDLPDEFGEWPIEEVSLSEWIKYHNDVMGVEKDDEVVINGTQNKKGA
jgi:hypothetical protein